MMSTIFTPPSLDAQTWTVDDLILAETLESWDVAPDGRTVVWVRSSVSEDDDKEISVSNLWRSRLEDGSPTALTRGKHQVSEPRFSPDGSFIAFLSDRKSPEGKSKDRGKQQVWVLPTQGGEAYPVTSFDRSVEDFAWTDAESLVVLAPESPSAWELERKKRKDTTQVVDDVAHRPPTRLFRVPLEGDASRLTTNQRWISSLSVSPDGRHGVITLQQDLKYNFDQKNKPQTFYVDLSTGSLKPLFEDGKRLPSGVRWAPDSSGFYFADELTHHPRYRIATVREIYYHDLAAGSTTKVDLDWPQGLGGEFLPLTDGILALLDDGITFRAAKIARDGDGWTRQDLSGIHAERIRSWQLSRDGRTLAYEHSTATQPTQLYGARLDGTRLVAETQLSDLNEAFDDKPTGKVEVLRFEGAGGDSVEALLHFPLDWPVSPDGPIPPEVPIPSKGHSDGTVQRRPLVVDIHGGPAGADRDFWDQRWSGPLLLYRQRGAFVLQVNYHGSAGYGLDWVESIAGRYYEQERVDILNGVDALIERGLVDPDRLGCTGWSNGGILTADLTTRTSRFKVAAVGAADIEWISDWANVDFGAAFDNYYFGGTPWEKTQEYIERSPFFRLGEVTTPTIVFTGTEDRNVPPHQSWSLYRGLQHFEKTSARLVLFPGELHGLRKIAHRRRKVEEEIAWFDRYLFMTEPGPDEALEKESLLAGLLERSKAARTGTALGLEVGGKLVPETVSLKGQQVGRFEVTRAQFAAFDTAYAVPAGTQNHPATSVTYRDAQRYVRWLTEITGRAFRLPSKEESEKLRKKVGKDGNTLDRWAGYSPNPEDAERLRKLLAQLPEEAPLLLPAGSLPGTGDDPVFDLDGNAAEWVVDAQGGGVPHGLSADRPIDSRNPGATTDPAYIGFRVVVGDEKQEGKKP